MVKKALFALALASIAVSPALAADADAVLGRWHTPSRDGIVEIVRCGPSICGRLVDSGGLHANPDLRDRNNRDAAQRNRRLKGLQILGGFTREGEKWDGGTIYNPEDGGTYKATISLSGPDRLKLKGCIVWPLCKTQEWTRAQ